MRWQAVLLASWGSLSFLHGQDHCISLCTKEEKLVPLPIGNFSVPTAVQIAPLVSFGQLLIGEKALLAQVNGNYISGHHQYAHLLAPNLIYGLRDDLDIAFFVPFTPKSQVDGYQSSGIGDLIFQVEYGYWMKNYTDHTLTASIVANIQFPTGAEDKNPRTGNGSLSYFLGTTLAYLSYNWYAFVSPGANVTTTHQRTKFGNAYLYQCGIARYIPQLSPKGWICNLMVELDGTYTAQDRIRGHVDPDSGGNVIILTPSLYLSSNRIVLQWGIGFPLLQSLQGNQDKIDYAIAYNIGIAFQF